MNQINATARPTTPLPVDHALDSRNSFSVERLDGGLWVTSTFSRGERVKVAGTFPMWVGVITGISHATRRAKVNHVWYDFGYVYKMAYDERAAPREACLKRIRNLEDRLNSGNSIDAQFLLDQVQNDVLRYQLHEFEPDLARLHAKSLELIISRRTSETTEKAARQAAADQRKRDEENPAKRRPQKLIRMTMEEWKKVHRDFKGKLPDGGRSVIHNGGLTRVEIVKDPAKSTRGQAIEVIPEED
ncbi:MAG: hypothetical protein EPN77_19375 [Candidimonas sp.]|nr:MAG: hypothetical protein EPN77_19375 [Candidimonas sp.]